MKMIKITLALFIIVSMCLACDNNDDYPKDYIGFEKSTIEHTYDKNNDIENVELNIVAGEKSDEDRKLLVYIPDQNNAFSIKNSKLIILKGKKSVKTELIIYPKKMFLEKRMLKIVCKPENQKIKESEMYIRLLKK